MRVRNFEKNQVLMPDSIAKQFLLKIVNTPPLDFTERDKDCADYAEMRFAEMTPEERKAYADFRK